ncbi:MAG: UDP-N-acetylmuramoyl-L-alanyl-D-glutamate--2,6-diaminopimelate ligase [Erysipelotrichaceae bacterium]|nr:UDP-N-acetylmuramoyl-L-alanyl-D-glutamate--2,6-diaminopimelate ligase [Erysipelotrichaceae bacterium]
MKLKDLFKDYQGIDTEITGISTNSKQLQNGDLFVCIKGANIDRHDFIDEAIANGASALVVSKDIKASIPVIKVDDVDKEFVNILKKYYENPQEKLTLIGITGTDGKTTSAKIIQQLIGNDLCGYIGTLGIDCKSFEEHTNNTTPSIEKLYESLDKFVKANMKYVAIEASSEGYFYHRLDGINFDIGCLTNITSEHLNTHKTLENYIECKKQLFINSNTQVLNSNDIHFNEIKKVSNDFVTYGTNNDNLIINSFKCLPNKTDICITLNNKSYNVETSLLGKFNVENLSLSLLALTKLGFNVEDLINKCNKLVIPGRMQVIDEGQDFYCIVDYAHTANAVKNVLEFANTLDVNRIVTITGQSGGRDPFKRKEVGKTTLELSSYAYLTQDDPRYEKVEDIIKMMLDSTDKTNYEIVLDRKEAIAKAVSNAQKNDLLLFLGKGVDKYMAIEDRRDYYDEIEEILKAIKK